MPRIALVLPLIWPVATFAQTSPNFSYGQVPTAGQWNAAFASKQDRLTFTPLNIAGGTMLGRLATMPSTINGAGFSLLPGIAPASPSEGDLWVTGGGLYATLSGTPAKIATTTGDASGMSVTLPNGTALTLPNAFRPIAESARTFPTMAAAAALDLSGETQVILTRRNPGDRAKPSLYAKVASKPADGANFQDKAGNWFEYAEPTISVYAMGALGNNSQDDTAAFQLAANVAAARGSGVIDAQGDNFLVSAPINIYSDNVHWLLNGSTISSNCTSCDILYFGFVSPGPYSLRANEGVHGGILQYTSGAVTGGSAVNFDRVQFGKIENVRTYGAFFGITVASSLNISLNNVATDNGSNWSALKPGSAGLRITRSPGSSVHNSVVDVTDSFITGNNVNRYTEFALLLQEVDGFRSVNSYFSFADKSVGLIPYDVNAPLSLIEFSNSGLDTPAQYSIYAPAMAGYAGNYVDNSFVGGYMYNAGSQFALLALQSTNVQNPWAFRSLKASRSQGDGFVVSGAGRYTFSGIPFRDMAAGGSGTATCIRLQNVTSAMIEGVEYEADASDTNFANSLISMEGTTNDVSVNSWKWKSRNSNPAILRAATAGINMTIGKGQSQEGNTFGNEHIVSSNLTIPASLSFVQMYASGTISGVDAASSWTDRTITIVFLNSGATLTSGTNFVLKGGSRTVATNDILKLWSPDGTIWREF